MRRIPGPEQRLRAIEEAFVALGYGPEPGAPAPKIVIDSTVPAASPRGNLITIPATGSRRNPIMVLGSPTPGSSRNPIEIPATPMEQPAGLLEQPPSPLEIPATPRLPRAAGRMFTPLFLSPTPSPVAPAVIMDLDPFVMAPEATPYRPAVGANRQDPGSSEVTAAEPKDPVNNRIYRSVGMQTDAKSPKNDTKHRTVGVQADMDALSGHSSPEPDCPVLSAPPSTPSSLPLSPTLSNSEIGQKRSADWDTASAAPSNRRRIEWHTPPSQVGSPSRARSPHVSSQADSGYLADCSTLNSADSPGVITYPSPSRTRRRLDYPFERTAGIQMVVVSSEDEEIPLSNPHTRRQLDIPFERTTGLQMVVVSSEDEEVLQSIPASKAHHHHHIVVISSSEENDTNSLPGGTSSKSAQL